jgi:hypothetical protein
VNKSSLGISSITFGTNREGGKLTIEIVVPRPDQRDPESTVVLRVLAEMAVTHEDAFKGSIADKLRAVADLCDAERVRESHESSESKQVVAKSLGDQLHDEFAKRLSMRASELAYGAVMSSGVNVSAKPP